MIYGLYLSTAGMITQQYRQDVIANNVANVETASFKRDVAIFRARQNAAAENPQAMRFAQPVLDDLGGGLLANPTYTVFEQGGMDVTDENLDLTINGHGFFAVQGEDGAIRYTRDGRFALDTEGFLTTVDRLGRVLNPDGLPVQIMPDLPVHVGSDGAVSQAGQVVGRIGLSDFDNRQMLRKVGGNYYEAPAGAAVRQVPAKFRAGAIERSTVDPTTELVAMIQAQRAYEANASLIRIQDQTLSRVVNDLARNV